MASSALVGGFLLGTRNKRQFARLRKGLRLSPSSGRRMVETPARVLAEGAGFPLRKARRNQGAGGRFISLKPEKIACLDF